MTTNPAITARDAAMLDSETPADMLPVAVPPPPESAVASHPDQALSTATTTTPVTDLLESVGVLAGGAAIPLLVAGPLFAGGAAVIAVIALSWAQGRRRRKARENEDDLRAPRYMFSAEQLATALASSPPPEAHGVFVALQLQPGEPLSQWQLAHLLASHMGDARSTEVLPHVLRYARRLA